MNSTTKTNEFDWPFEICGFGGGYEQACRDMAKAGAIWLREHPEELQKWRAAAKSYKEYTGRKFVPDSAYPETYKEFEAALLKPCDDCTGAMFGASKGHAITIFEMGWDKYVEYVLEARGKRQQQGDNGKETR